MLTRENNLEPRGAILRPAARILIEFTAIFNFTSIFNFAYANTPPFYIKDIFADACPLPFMLSHYNLLRRIEAEAY